MAALPAGVSEWGGTAQGETLGETEIETEETREGQQGGGQSDSKGALGDEVSAIVRRHRRLREDEEKVETEEAGVSRVMGVGLKAGQLEELGVQEERRPEEDIRSRCQKRNRSGQVGWG